MFPFRLTDIYPTQQQQPQQQQAVLKPISISTKTDTVSTISYATHAPVMSYEQINGLLHSVHIERFGNPETRCQEQDVDMTEVDNEYSDMNSVLRQAFLQRH